MFEYALTYRGDTVVRAGQALLSRVAPRLVGADPFAGPAAPRVAAAVLPARPRVAATTGDAVLERALGATNSGVTIADMTRPDAPLVFVNAAFEGLAGFRVDDLLGRNCRFLQGPDTDRAAVARIRTAVRGGRGVPRAATQLPRPRPPAVVENEVHLSPVTDADGRVVQYIGVQNDVTDRVEAERALRQETDRAQAYLSRIEQLAYTDPVTGLMNRRRIEERVETELWEAQASDSALALLFLDLDGFKAVNDGDGLELLNFLRRVTPHPPIVAMSGGGDGRVGNMLKSRGARGPRASSRNPSPRRNCSGSCANSSDRPCVQNRISQWVVGGQRRE